VTGETCICGAELVRTGGGRLACSRAACSGLPPAERPRNPITPGDYAGWVAYEPPVADGQERDGDDDDRGDGRWWV